MNEGTKIDWSRFSDDVLRDFRSMASRYPDMNKLLIEVIDQELRRRAEVTDGI